MRTQHRPARGGTVGARTGAPVALSSSSALREFPALTRLPVALLGALLVLALASPGTAEALAWPVAVAGVLLGVPHGAADHLLPWWWSGGRAASRGSLLRVAGAYAAAASAAAGVLLLAPAPTLGLLLVLSGMHFGRGEVVAWAERAGRSVPAPRTDLLPAAAHGVAVVGLLVWAAPTDTDPYLRALSAPVADAARAARGPGLTLAAILVVAAVAGLLRAGRCLDAAELALVSGTFAVAPPLAAFGAYFGLWHAVRHMGRLLDLARAGAQPATWSGAAARLARGAALPTVVAWACIGALWGLRNAVSLPAALGVLLALTVPHTAVVWALDRRRAAA